MASNPRFFSMICASLLIILYAGCNKSNSSTTQSPVSNHTADSAFINNNFNGSRPNQNISYSDGRERLIGEYYGTSTTVNAPAPYDTLSQWADTTQFTILKSGNDSVVINFTKAYAIRNGLVNPFSMAFSASPPYSQYTLHRFLAGKHATGYDYTLTVNLNDTAMPVKLDVVSILMDPDIFTHLYGHRMATLGPHEK